MTPQEMYVLAAGLGEAKSRQNVEDALKFLHADMVLYSPAWGAVARGLGENRQLLSHFFDSYPDYSVSFEGYVADVETLFGWGIVRMTMAAHASDARGMTPNGQRIKLPVTIHMTFKDGLIATEHFSCDLAQIAAQSASPSTGCGGTCSAHRQKPRRHEEEKSRCLMISNPTRPIGTRTAHRAWSSCSKRA